MENLKEIKVKINEIKLLTHDVLDLIILEGQGQAADFLKYRDEIAQLGDRSKFSLVGTRVRKNGASFTAEWHRNKLYRNKNDNKVKAQAQYIRQSSSAGYSDNIFNGEPLWVSEVGIPVESRYKYLRRQSAILSNIRRKIAEYERSLIKYESVGSNET